MATAALLLLAVVCWTAVPVCRAALWEVTNEIGPYPEKRGLTTCRRSAVCGLVQANAWGINTEAFCNCMGREPCPLHWDPEDGRSVTHGSNQYKYCQRAPELAW
ncbi:U-scoloptoxin(11)-Sm5a-like [Pollicipes pollicipes]|uniref:U-scoloptoxin(11)-Sm5a-like n=1 Tax=Pollicipes pollicipes TaxID=41117 RepID=UPI0018859867|nr:U-scoloptoxin(11)-Sm5a-like [Pollicipes pollicipes]